jgi:hypothetical protein
LGTALNLRLFSLVTILGSCTVMIKGTLTSLAFAAVCAIALAVPAAQAQVIDTQGQLRTMPPRLKAGQHADWIAGSNNTESAQYEYLLQNDPAFRQSRAMKECGPITDAHLRAGCLDSFGVYEDQRSPGWNEGLTGGSTDTTIPLGKPPFNLDMYGAGAGR